MLSLLLSLVVLGCSKDGDDSTSAEADADPDTDTDTDTDTDADCAVLDGMVVTESGGANDDVRVQMCNDLTCYPQSPNDGAYEFPCLPATDYAFELAPTAEGVRYPSPSSPITLVKGEQRTIGSVVLEPFTNVYESFTAGTYDFDGGLAIEADPADMIAGGAAVELQGFLAGMVAPFEWGLPIDDEKLPVADQGGTLVAMWYLGQFDVELANPWPFTATNDYGLAAGTVLDVLAMDYGTQSWAVGGTATVSKDGKLIVTDPGSGIPVLATLLLVDPL